MARGRTRENGSQKQDSAARLGFEAKLWQAADALRNNMDAAEYKHVVLGLIFLKYISDAFEAKHAELDAQRGEGADPEDPDEYRAENIFWVPPEARWSYLKGAAPQPTIGQIVDEAMAAIERDNPSLKSVLPRDYARPGRNSPVPRARRAASSTPRPMSCACWSRCWRPTKAGSMTRAAARAACSCRARNSSRRIAAASATSRSTARNRIDLRPGIELHDLAPREDEPRDPRHRCADRAW